MQTLPANQKPRSCVHVGMGRMRWFVVAWVMAACGGATHTARSAGDRSVAKAPVPAAGDTTLTVMTFNVNFGVAGDDSTIAAIRDAGADVVFLEETNQAWEDALRRSLAGDYPHMTFHHCCRAGGLAVLSKLPFTEKDYLPAVAGGWFPALRVIVATPLGDVQVMSVHLHPPLDEQGNVLGGYWVSQPIRRAEIESHAAHLDATLPTLVVGDFNEDADGQAVKLLAARGFESTLAALHGHVRTWHWQLSIARRSMARLGRRAPAASLTLGTVSQQLDHILHDARLTAVSARVIEAGRSDHFPVVATFRRRAR